jgi:hypothetical protein
MVRAPHHVIVGLVADIKCALHPFLFLDSSTIKNAHDDNCWCSEMSTIPFGWVGVDIARSAPIPCYNKGTGLCNLMASFRLLVSVQGSRFIE